MLGSMFKERQEGEIRNIVYLFIQLTVEHVEERQWNQSFLCKVHCGYRGYEYLHSLYCWHGKWNESGFRPPLCTYRLNWARRTSWGWWDDSKFEPWRSEVEHATSRSRRLPTILTFTSGWGRNYFCFFQTAETGNQTPNSGVRGSGANHYPRAPALLAWRPPSITMSDGLPAPQHAQLECFHCLWFQTPINQISDLDWRLDQYYQIMIFLQTYNQEP